jgi:hypothetical protein
MSDERSKQCDLRIDDCEPRRMAPFCREFDFRTAAQNDRRQKLEGIRVARLILMLKMRSGEPAKLRPMLTAAAAEESATEALRRPPRADSTRGRADSL